jgi:hypothetical protein
MTAFEKGVMSLRKLLEKDVLIRLDDSSFVETIRYFGLPEKSLTWETMETVSGDVAPGGESFILARVPPKRIPADGNTV